MNPYKVRFFDDYTGSLHIVITRIDGLKSYVAKFTELKFEEVPEGYFFKEPTFKMSALFSYLLNCLHIYALIGPGN